MKESDIISTMTVHYTSEGEGQVAAAANTVVTSQDKVAASANALATAVESSAKRQASAAAALDALARRSDPAARALAELEKTYKDVTRALSFDQSPVAIDKANKALDFYRDRLVAAEAQQKLFFGTMSGNTIDKALNVGGSSPAGSARESADVFLADVGGLQSVAQAKAAQIGQAFGVSLNESMIAGVAKSARESASVFTAEMDRLDTIAQQKATQIGKNFQDDLNQSFNIGGGSKSARDSAAIFEEAAKAQDDMAASATRLRTAINPLEAEQGKLGAETARYRDLLKQNIITQDEFNAHQVITSKRLGDFAQNLKQAGTAGRVMSGEMTNLGFQLNDVVTGLALGQSPFMILAQQGGQIVQIFANSRSSIADFARSSVSWLGSLMTPMNGLIVGAVAVSAAIAKLAADYDKLQVSSQRALIGAGERTGTTVTDLNKFTEQNSGINTTGLSNKEARALGEDLTKTGEIVVSQLHNMSAAVVGFANQSGQSIEEARKAFVGFAVDPKKGLEELTKTFGDVDVDTRKLVDAFVIAGDKTEALNVLVDALADRSKKAAANMTTLEQAGRGFNTLFNKEIAGTKPTGIEDQLAAAQAAMANAQHALSGGLQQGDSSDVLKILSQRLADATKEVEKFKAASDSISSARATRQLDNLSTAADGVVKAIIPQIAQIEELQKKLEALDLAKTFGAPSKEGGSVDNAATVAIQNQLAALRESQAEAARYNLEVKNISSSWGNVGQSVALQLQAMENALPVARAWTEAGKMRAQYEATYLDLLNKGKTAQEATAIASKQEELTKASAVASAQKLVQSSEDNLDKIKAQGTEMEAVVASSIAYRDAIQAGATSTQAAAIAANTLEANLIQAAKAADQVAASAAAAADQAARAAGASSFTLQKNAFGDFNVQPGEQHTSTSSYGSYLITLANSLPTATQLIAQATASGVDAGIQQLLNTQLVTGYGDLGIPGFSPGSTFQDSGLQTKGTQDDITSALLSLYDIKAGQAGSPEAATAVRQQEIAALQSGPQTQKTLDAIANLTQSITGLTTSTNSLNATNSELLSPYYTQDPRTSHIGFRSQGMASGGSFVVPGGYSSNDNMVGQIPLASGEVVNVSRPGEGGARPIMIYQTINIQGGANRDEVGRTQYHNGQNLARQLRASAL